jgi:hypothetical protein
MIYRGFRALRTGRGLLLAAGALGVAAAGVAVLYGLGSLIHQARPRTLDLCVVSDTAYRMQRPNWQDGLRPVFEQVNRMFARTGVVWRIQYAPEAYPAPGDSSMEDRIGWVGAASCKADVVMGLTGQRDSDTDSIVWPYTHLLLVSEEGASDTMRAMTLSRALGGLFGVPVPPGTLIADAPDGEVFDSVAAGLIHEMRDYDFAQGVSALTPKWESRAVPAIAKAAARRSPRPEAEAHRILARTFEKGRRNDDALRHLREAVAGDPENFHLRLDLARVLESGGAGNEAIAELQAAAKLDPSSPLPHAAMGITYYNIGRFDLAAAELRAASDLSPRTAAYKVVLGEVERHASAPADNESQLSSLMKSAAFSWFGVADDLRNSPKRQSEQ